VGKTVDTNEFLWVRAARKVEKTLNEFKQTRLASRKVDEHTNLRDKGGWEGAWGTNKQHRDSNHRIGLQKL